MNIHEHQAKEILKEYGAPVSKGFVVHSVEEIKEKISYLNSKSFVLKAQIHAGGRGKAGGVKLVKDLNELEVESAKMMGKKLFTHQTGPEGKKVKRLYVEEASNILKEFYLSCLIDRQSSKIVFISSTAGGMDIEKVASETPNQIVTTKIEFKEKIKDEEVEKIIKPFNFLYRSKNKNLSRGVIDSSQNLFLKFLYWSRVNFFYPDARFLQSNNLIQFLTKFIDENNINTIISSSPPHSIHKVVLKLN